MGKIVKVNVVLTKDQVLKAKEEALKRGFGSRNWRAWVEAYLYNNSISNLLKKLS